MKYKVGDILISKINSKGDTKELGSGWSTYFTKGKSYPVISIGGTLDTPLYFFENDLVGIVQSFQTFLFENQTDKVFCNDKELRKLKLEKINERR